MLASGAYAADTRLSMTAAAPACLGSLQRIADRSTPATVVEFITKAKELNSNLKKARGTRILNRSASRYSQLREVVQKFSIATARALRTGMQLRNFTPIGSLSRKFK